MESASLSKIALSNSHGEDSPYFAGWKLYNEDPYDAVNNPSGVIQMGLAENQVSFDLLEEYIEAHPEASTWSAAGTSGTSSFRENAMFQDYHGLQDFRKAMASFMEKLRGGKVKFDHQRIVLTAGATAANELVTFILANPGEALLVPTPYYPGFDRDLRWRTGVNIIPVHCDSSNDFQICKKALEDAYLKATSEDIKVKGLILTNPSNPLGKSISRNTLEEAFDFVVSKNIHLVSDEINCGSVFSPTEFVSISEILKDRNYENCERVHVTYSLSKDLGLPGFRVGTIYSYNDEVVITARRMSSFTLVSSQTQKTLAMILSDEDFMEKYIQINRDRLRTRYEFMIDGLKSVGIECLQSNAGLFCWMDLRPFLDENSLKGELKMWNLMMDEVKLNISPGSSCRCIEAGWFRVCFANVSQEVLGVALKRICDFMKRRKKEREVFYVVLLFYTKYVVLLFYTKICKTKH